MAWVTIWASSMAARAGLSQPLLERTSTQAWMSRMACRGTDEHVWVGWALLPRRPRSGPHTPDAQSPHLAEDLLSIRLQLSAQLHAGQVSLQKQVGLDMWVVELRVIQLVGNLLGQLESGAKSSW